MPNTIDSPEKTASSNSNFEWNWDWNYQNEDDEQSRIKKLYRKAVSDQW